ncbi:outer membrane beta-barrel protein [Flavobacterium sp. P21]|uniref:outer membrane beta-barrel protein n=1 Tax=Flavobacterium sp. P21 TaxID=3423948 RepID=UPI003D664E8E
MRPNDKPSWSDFQLQKNKTVFSAGSKFSGVKFKQYDVYRDSSFDRKFVNYMPQISYQYNFKQRESLRLSYNGNNDQPTLEQIQPIPNNQNPLNTILGNPNLDPSFKNSFRGNYYSYKVLSNQYFSVNGSYNFTLDPIISNVVTNERGQSISQFVNLKNKAATSYYLNSNFGKTIKAIDMSAGIGLSASKNLNYNYINTKLNQTKNSTYSLNLNLSKNKEKSIILMLASDLLTTFLMQVSTKIVIVMVGGLMEISGPVYNCLSN